MYQEVLSPGPDIPTGVPAHGPGFSSPLLTWGLREKSKAFFTVSIILVHKKQKYKTIAGRKERWFVPGYACLQTFSFLFFLFFNHSPVSYPWDVVLVHAFSSGPFILRYLYHFSPSLSLPPHSCYNQGPVASKIHPCLRIYGLTRAERKSLIPSSKPTNPVVIWTLSGLIQTGRSSQQKHFAPHLQGRISPNHGLLFFLPFSHDFGLNKTNFSKTLFFLLIFLSSGEVGKTVVEERSRAWL